MIAERVDALLAQMSLKEKISLISGMDTWRTVPVERLKIPSLVMTDGPHGVRTVATAGRIPGPATSFPTGVSMAASWNVELVQQVGAALGEETRALGCDILLGPCVNIIRHPLAGRNFEAYSEDPYLAGRIGVAWTRGVQSQNVGASLKHFACNNQEAERYRGNSVVDERTLREIYLSQFEMVVKEAQPWTVMTSYNRINGVYAAQNRHLLTEILRTEWGFEGLVISDWTGNHSTIESIRAGLDIEMPGPAKYFGQLLWDAVATWQVEQTAIDEAVRRVLRTIIVSGRMEARGTEPEPLANTPAHEELARRLAEDSITLLKNENGMLPLDPSVKSIAVIGANAAEPNIGGGGSSFAQPPHTASPWEGLERRLRDKVILRYERGADNFDELPPIPKSVLTPAQGSGQGLCGEYFENVSLEGSPVYTRLDAGINFRRGTFTLMDRTPKPFSVRWTGTLTVPTTGCYTFKLETSGICRLYVEGDLIGENNNQDDLDGYKITRPAFQVHLETGRPYRLKVEFVRPPWLDLPHIRLLFAATPAPDNRIAHAVELAKTSDVAIVFAGLAEGFESEGSDRAHMGLPGRQDELISKVAAANPKTVVVLYCGAPVAMPWIGQVPAAIAAFYPGQEGGHAIARVLVGDVNPSGKLPMTYPKQLADTPAFLDYPGERDVRYGEGIFVGYRYYDRRQIEPLFPFGHGLSYTTFEYRDLHVPASAKRDEPVQVSVTVTNTGRRTGQEAVQLYVGDRLSSLPRPAKELKGFVKVKLESGESKTVTFSLDRRAFAFYDPNRKQWVVEPGEFDVLVGSSSREIRARATLLIE